MEEAVWPLVVHVRMAGLASVAVAVAVAYPVIFAIAPLVSARECDSPPFGAVFGKGGWWPKRSSWTAGRSVEGDGRGRGWPLSFEHGWCVRSRLRKRKLVSILHHGRHGRPRSNGDFWLRKGLQETRTGPF